LSGEAFSTAAFLKYTTGTLPSREQISSVVGQRTGDLEAAGTSLVDSLWERLIERATENSIKGLEVLDASGLYSGCSLECAEYAFLPQYGNARLDIAFRDEIGGLILVDWKLTGRAPARFAYYHQMHHYAWCAREWWEEMPSRVELCIIGKEEAQVIPVSVTEESLEQWLQTSKEAWRQMEQHKSGAVKPWMNPTHANSYGACEYQRFCLDFAWDEQLAKADYVKVERHA
jgi:hypothetical protein